MKNKPFTIGEHQIEPGTRTSLFLPMSNLTTQTKMDLPVHVFHGKHAGPKVFILGTIHGDELNSIEIIRRVHKHSALKQLRGTLITIPVVNCFGLILQSRYLPDRRDLNRSFPGAKEGSLAARMAYLLLDEIISKCNYGIDLHTGAVGRTNMPQLRVNLETPGADKLAKAFGVPVIISAKIRDGSVRQAASELGIPLLVYEGGEALRFNESCIRAASHGIMNVLAFLNMIPPRKKIKSKSIKPLVTEVTQWVRASVSGLVQPLVEIAKTIKKGKPLAYIHDPYLMNKSTLVTAPFDGIIIGKINLPLINEGDAMYNLASIKKLKPEAIAQLVSDLDEVMNQY